MSDYRDPIIWTLLVLVMSILIVAANFRRVFDNPDIISTVAFGAGVILFVGCIINLISRAR